MERYEDFYSEELAFVEKQIDAGYCVRNMIDDCKCESCERDRFNEQLIDDLVAAGVEF